MDWEHLFDDLEGQLAADWESERAALDAESERLRIAKLSLRERLRTLRSAGAQVRLELTCGEQWDCALRVVGVDWIGVLLGADARLRIVPLSAVESLGADHGMLLASLAEPESDADLRGRMSLGFMLRDLARRRLPVTLRRRTGDPQHGTIDRAGADHLDLALHDVHEARHARSVRGFRSIPFAAVSWVRVEEWSTAL